MLAIQMGRRVSPASLEVPLKDAILKRAAKLPFIPVVMVTRPLSPSIHVESVHMKLTMTRMPSCVKPLVKNGFIESVQA